MIWSNKSKKAVTECGVIVAIAFLYACTCTLVRELLAFWDIFTQWE